MKKIIILPLVWLVLSLAGCGYPPDLPAKTEDKPSALEDNDAKIVLALGQAKAGSLDALELSDEDITQNPMQNSMYYVNKKMPVNNINFDATLRYDGTLLKNVLLRYIYDNEEDAIRAAEALAAKFDALYGEPITNPDLPDRLLKANIKDGKYIEESTDAGFGYTGFGLMESWLAKQEDGMYTVVEVDLLTRPFKATPYAVYVQYSIETDKYAGALFH